MARTATRRHLHPAGQLDVLLPTRHVSDRVPHPDSHLLALRTPLTRQRRRDRVALRTCLALLAVTVLTLAAVGRSDAADEIRVGLVEDGRTVEVGGGPM